MFLSIIIPVYNAEKYISDCLDSLLEQDISRTQYEIICVNGGSTDSSVSIIQSYQQQSNNIVLINQSNHGVSVARNSGIKAAKGDWIWLVDSDDLIQNNILSKLEELSHNNDLNRIEFQEYIFYDYLTSEEIDKRKQGEIESNNPDNGICLSLFKRSLIIENQIWFNLNLSYAEDLLWMCEYREIGDNSVFFPKVCYYYRQHLESATHSGSVEAVQQKLMSHILAAEKAYEIYTCQIIKKHDTANDVIFFLRIAMLLIAEMPVAVD